MMWDVPGYGWLFRCFHLHPFVIRVDRDDPYFLTKFIVSLDEEYVPRLFRSVDRIHFPKWSDDFAMCSLREIDSPPQPLDGPPHLDMIYRWAEEYAALLHRDFIQQPFVWTPLSHDEPNASQAWLDVTEKSLKTTTMIRERLNTPDSVLRFENEIAFSARMRRRRRFNNWRNPVFHEFAPHDANPQETASDTAIRPGSTLRILSLLMRNTGLYKLKRFPILFRAWMWLKAALR